MVALDEALADVVAAALAALEVVAAALAVAAALGAAAALVDGAALLVAAADVDGAAEAAVLPAEMEPVAAVVPELPHAASESPAAAVLPRSTRKRLRDVLSKDILSSSLAFQPGTGNPFDKFPLRHQE